MTSLGTICIQTDTMSANIKPEPTSDFEVESHDLSLHPKLKTLNLLDGARVALTALGLLAGVTVLGVSADAVAVYEATHLPPEYNLPLWPKNFNIGPTIALVVCGTIIILANGASLALCRGKSVSCPNTWPFRKLYSRNRNPWTRSVQELTHTRPKRKPPTPPRP